MSQVDKDDYETWMKMDSQINDRWLNIWRAIKMHFVSHTYMA